MLGKAVRMLARGVAEKLKRSEPLDSPAIEVLLKDAWADLTSGNKVGAMEAVTKILANAPHHSDALHLHGILLYEARQADAACAAFSAAISTAPKNAALHADFGSVLLALGRFAEAVPIFQQAIALAPNSPLLYRGLGRAQLELQRPADASASLGRALAMAPNDIPTLIWLGTAAYRDFDFATAEDCFAKAEKLGPLDWSSCYLYGIVLTARGRFEAACAMLKSALRNAPKGQPDIAYRLGCADLLAGNWQEGFSGYETRLDDIRHAKQPSALTDWLHYIDKKLAPIPLWQGNSPTSRKLLIWHEQGLGDTIMMVRLLPVLLKDYGAANVTFLGIAAERCLVEALGNSNVRFIEATPNWAPEPGQFDAHCSVMSLPHRMNLTPAYIPGIAPYLFPRAADREQWRTRLATIEGKKIGVVWAGNPALPANRLRNIDLKQLAPLFDCAGCTYVSLQKDEISRQQLRSSSLPFIDWMDKCDTLIDTAALIAELDLVIAVDTAVAHLAGAVGTPVWLLNRFESEWRWMRDREDSVWYPSMRIFSQTQSQQWGQVIARVVKEMDALSA